MTKSVLKFLVVMMVACGPAKLDLPGSDSRRSSEAQPAPSETPSPPSEEAIPTETPTPTADPEPTPESEDPETKNRQNILAACGLTTDGTIPDGSYNKTWALNPFMITGDLLIGSYSAHIEGAIETKFVEGAIELSRAWRVAAVEPDRGQDEAQGRIARYNAKLKFVPSAVAQKSEDIRCSSLTTNTMTVTRGEKTVTWTFDKEIPLLVSQLLSAERFGSELSAPIEISDIVAKVTESNDDNLPKNTERKGKISTEAVDPMLAYSQGGMNKSLMTPQAYKISVDFGSPVNTRNMGLVPETRLYIDNAQKLYAAIVLDYKDNNNIPVAIFLPKPALKSVTNP